MNRVTRSIVVIVAFACLTTGCKIPLFDDSTPATLPATPAAYTHLTFLPPSARDFRVIGDGSYAVKCSRESIQGTIYGLPFYIKDRLYPKGKEMNRQWQVDEVNRLVGPRYSASRVGDLHASDSVKWFYRSVVFNEIMRRTFAFLHDPNSTYLSYAAPASCRLYAGAKVPTTKNTATS